MNRMRPEHFVVRELALEAQGGSSDPLASKVTGLLVTCSAECFPPEALDRELAPGTWLVHRTPGNIVPPFGVGEHVEEELVERAVNDLRIGSLVVCGHHPCGIAAHLLADGEPADDFVLRDWLSHAESARQVLRGRRNEDRARAAAAHNVLAQLANLRTHPAVAAALAHGRLNLWGWLHAGELLSASPGQPTFDCPVALDPLQNRDLRRERVLQLRRPSSCGAGAPRWPYLA